MNLEGSTPEGFKAGFKGCAIAVALLMTLLLIAVAVTLVDLRKNSAGKSEPSEQTDPVSKKTSTSEN